jgi:hypothetical protein
MDKKNITDNLASKRRSDDFHHHLLLTNAGDQSNCPLRWQCMPWILASRLMQHWRANSSASQSSERSFKQLSFAKNSGCFKALLLVGVVLLTKISLCLVMESSLARLEPNFFIIA